VPGTQHPMDAQLPLEPDISWLRLDNKSIGVHYGAWFVTFVLRKWKIDLGEEFLRKTWEQVLADHSSLIRDIPSAAFDLRQDDVEGVLLQEAAKFWASGDLARAGKLARDFIVKQDEALTGRHRQREYACKDRGDTLGGLIYEIVEERGGSITSPELLANLKDLTGAGVIEEVTDEKIWFVCADGTSKSAPVSGLRGRLYREKDNFKKTLSR